ncbi:MAG TPA: hypothetical protein VMU19_00940 [Bryobacteraceae bacterium]|nr:hypothetical protein [Bryobacteraceae bacterium]
MTEDVFRIVIATAVALAAIAFLIQTALLAGIARAVRRIEEKGEPLMNWAAPVFAKLGPAVDQVQDLVKQAGPAVEKAGPALERASALLEAAIPAVEQANKVLASAEKMVEETRPRVAAITDDVAGMARSGREQVDRIGVLLHDAGERAAARLDQIEGAVDSTVEHVERASGAVKRAVLRPVREANGLAAGIAAAVATLMRGRKFSVDSATQDEEMFI